MTLESNKEINKEMKEYEELRNVAENLLGCSAVNELFESTNFNREKIDLRYYVFAYEQEPSEAELEESEVDPKILSEELIFITNALGNLMINSLQERFGKSEKTGE